MTSLPEGRQEVKFVARATAFHEIVQWLRVHHLGFVQPYPQRQVNNVYFDAPGFDSYAESVAGVGSRAKVRYRWYGGSTTPQAGQLEAKIKRGHVGWKRVWQVAEPIGEPTSAHALRDWILRCVPQEAWPWLVEFSQPVLRNRYTRSYWTALLGELRVTVDRDLAVFSPQRGSSLTLDRSMRTQKTVVLELKFRNGARGTVSQMLQGMPWSASRNSKYCKGASLLREV